MPRSQSSSSHFEDWLLSQVMSSSPGLRVCNTRIWPLVSGHVFWFKIVSKIVFLIQLWKDIRQMNSMYSYVNLKNWVSTSHSPFWFILESAASNVFRKSDVGSWENGWNGWSCFLRIERLSITFSYFDHLYHLFPPSITLCIAFAKLHLRHFFQRK